MATDVAAEEASGTDEFPETLSEMDEFSETKGAGGGGTLSTRISQRIYIHKINLNTIKFN